MSAFCAMVRRKVETLHKIMRELCVWRGSPRVGGDFPHKKTSFLSKDLDLTFRKRAYIEHA